MYLLTRLLPHSLAGDPYHDPKANMFRQDDPKAKKTSDKPFASKVPLAHFSTHYITHTHTHAHIRPLYHIITASCHVITQSPTIAYLCSHSLTT